MNELGIVINLAHCGYRSALEAIEASKDPVFNAHISCRGVYDDPDRKNVDDDYLRILAKKGGVAGVYPQRLRPDPTMDYSFNAYAPNLEHAIKVACIDHVGISSDLTYLPDEPPRAMDWTNWPYYTVGLVCRGFNDEEIKKIIGGNFLRLAAKVLDKQPWGPFIAKDHGYAWVPDKKN